MRAECLILNEAGRVLETLARLFTAGLDERQTMPFQTITRTVQFKLYPNAEQVKTLESWLRTCCWLYNRCLEQRIKAYKRRKESPTLYSQQVFLTLLRSRMEWLRSMPAQFQRDALRRVDRGMKAFFRRLKAGEKPGFPRFKKRDRYRSLEQIQPGKFIRDKAIFIPGISEVRSRGRFGIDGKQLGLRIIKRATGWYAQIIVEMPVPAPLPETGQECGIDLGLETFATLDSGERIENPRTLRRSEKKMKAASRRLAKCQRGSKRRLKAKKRLARIHECVERQRSGFCHRVSRNLVNRFDRIAVEALIIKGLAAGMLAKSVRDAAWGIFLRLLRYKAESAGRVVVEVDPNGTSQECPRCGAVARKELSERTHRCGCGLTLHRDHAAAMIVRQRAFRPVRGGSASTPVTEKVGPLKRAGLSTLR